MIALLITALTAGVLRCSRRLDRRLTTAALALLAVAAAVDHVDGFAFHDRGDWIHYHDAAHYYLGARYFPELGYTGLYVAMLAAEEDDTGTVAPAVVRDLAADRLVASDTLMAQAPAVRARFDDERWRDFRRDAAFFRHALGERYQGFLVDHGFNPTPAWALVGGALAQLVPPGSGRGILLLCLLDALLLTVVWAMIARTFGLRAALAGGILFCAVFEGGFAWTGGAFLRHLWLAAVLAACCLLRRRPAGAGALFALATALRIFPAVFVAGIAARGAWRLVDRRPLRRRHARCLAAFAATGAGLFATTALLPGGLGAWRLFLDNLTLYLGTEAANFVGLKRLFAWTLAELLPAWGDQVAVAVSGVHLLAVALTMAAVVGLARGGDETAATALGGLLLFVGLDMAAYYYVFLVVLVLAHRRRPRALAMIFTVEAASHLAGLAVGWLDVGVLDVAYVARSLLMLWLFGGLYLERGIAELRRMATFCTRAVRADRTPRRSEVMR